TGNLRPPEIAPQRRGARPADETIHGQRRGLSTLPERPILLASAFGAGPAQGDRTLQRGDPTRRRIRAGTHGPGRLLRAVGRIRRRAATRDYAEGESRGDESVGD